MRIYSMRWAHTKTDQPYVVLTDSLSSASVMYFSDHDLWIVRYPFGVYSAKQTRKEFKTLAGAWRHAMRAIAKFST